MHTHAVESENPAQPETVENVQPSPYVGRITELLAAAGHPNPEAWKAHLHSDAYITNDDSIQRFLINRALRLSLADCPKPTMDERYCLVDTGPMERWAQLIEQKVVPCLVEHNLPLTK